jgi:[amino group carrier protein]-L-2-aminoadipate 6-kinase
MLMTGLTVIKCGGTAGVNHGHVCRDVAGLVRAGSPVILVHGGSADIAELAAALAVPDVTLDSPSGMSSRHTSAAMLEVVTLALAGRVKPRLVRCLQGEGVRAVGLTGMDGGLVLARPKAGRRAVVDGRILAVHDEHSGRIASVDPTLLLTLLEAAFTPVLSPPVLDSGAGALNVDADRLAAAVAVACAAHELILLTGAPGVLRDPADETSRMPIVRLSDTTTADLPASGGMRMKLLAAREALAGGVGNVLIADGRVDHPIQAARAGAATRVLLAPRLVGSTA